MSDLTGDDALIFNFLGDLIDHGQRRCPYETRWPALAGALVGLATATGNRFAVRLSPGNLIALNLYVALVGGTGEGKDSALRFAEAIAAGGGVKPSAFSSDVALHRALAAEPKDGSDAKTRLVLWDEFGHALQQLKADKAGHQRAMLTKLLEVRGLAIDGVLPERRYADVKQNLPAVRSPFVSALFTTTPSTLHDALTSREVVDGSLNRMLVLYLDGKAPLRPLETIANGPLPEGLVDPLAWLRPRIVEVEGAEPGPYKIKPCELLELPGESIPIGGQSFKAIEVDPRAMMLLTEFRIAAEERKRADERLGALWARAFENAVKIAGLSALGFSLGELGPCAPEISVDDARFGIALVEYSLAELAGDLRENLADHEAGRIQNTILRHARALTQVALAEPNPTAEHVAPRATQDEIRTLKRNGFFAKRDLMQRVRGGARSSRDVEQEIKTLISAGDLEMIVIEWRTTMNTRQRREFFFCGGPREAAKGGGDGR